MRKMFATVYVSTGKTVDFIIHPIFLILSAKFPLYVSYILKATHCTPQSPASVLKLLTPLQETLHNHIAVNHTNSPLNVYMKLCGIFCICVRKPELSFSHQWNPQSLEYSMQRMRQIRPLCQPGLARGKREGGNVNSVSWWWRDRRTGSPKTFNNRKFSQL